MPESDERPHGPEPEGEFRAGQEGDVQPQPDAAVESAPAEKLPAANDVEGIRAEVDALSDEEKAAIREQAASYSWDNLNRDGVVGLRTEINASADRIVGLLVASGQKANSEKVTRLAAMARATQTTKLIDHHVPAPNVVSRPEGEDGTEAMDAGEALRVVQRLALDSMLSAPPEEFDAIMRNWDLHNKLRRVAQHDSERDEAKQGFDKFKAERAAARKELSDKHNGLLDKVNEMPVAWKDIKGAIEGSGNPHNGYAARLEKFRAEQLDGLTAQLEELLGEPGVAKEAAMDIFVNTYVSEQLMGLLPGDKADDATAETMRDNLCTLLQEEGAIADMDAYTTNLVVGDQNYAQATPEAPAADDTPTAEITAQPTRGEIGGVASHKKRWRDGLIGRIVTTKAYRDRQ